MLLVSKAMLVFSKMLLVFSKIEVNLPSNSLSVLFASISWLCKLMVSFSIDLALLIASITNSCSAVIDIFAASKFLFSSSFKISSASSNNRVWFALSVFRVLAMFSAMSTLPDK